MWAFVIAGALYLTGVAVVLVLKPAFMFTPEGQWKEFGIGQNENRYTPFPFWLFCLVWALISYVLVVVVQKGVRGLGGGKSKSREIVIPSATAAAEASPYDVVEAAPKLPKGYYMLNKRASRLAGVPKYVYLGAEQP